MNAEGEKWLSLHWKEKGEIEDTLHEHVVADKSFGGICDESTMSTIEEPLTFATIIGGCWLENSCTLAFTEQ